MLGGNNLEKNKDWRRNNENKVLALRALRLLNQKKCENMTTVAAVKKLGIETS